MRIDSVRSEVNNHLTEASQWTDVKLIMCENAWKDKIYGEIVDNDEKRSSYTNIHISTMVYG